ncbi:3-keto-5-aminohexanoate cleavage protein [Streptomyces sp. NPDC059534]|uniref:3-keto-5-aminohexanoate cleavage protein n=1 Tax=Streptomyces sp. NPDC059534 TaxID=3346859 RepID=UPI00368D565B
MLQVCLNGSRGPGDTAAVPMSPESLAASAASAVTAGAREIRVHPRTPCGRTSLSPRVLAPVLTSLGAALGAAGAGAGVPAGAPVRITTAMSAEPDTERRVERVRSWAALPGLVSVDWHEPGAEEVASALLSRGIAVEAALWSGTDGPARFARSPLAPRVARVLARAHTPAARAGPPAGPVAAAEAVALALLSDIARPAGVPLLLHGVDGGAWPVLRLARRLGLARRIGLEDTLLLPDGTRARSNAELVAAAVAGPGVVQ